MSNAFTGQLIATLSTGASTDRTKSIARTLTVAETFWTEARLAAGASNEAIALNLLTLPKAIVVFGGPDVWVRLSNDAVTPKLYADPYLVLFNQKSGMAQTSLWLGNDGTGECIITVIAVES